MTDHSDTTTDEVDDLPADAVDAAAPAAGSGPDDEVLDLSDDASTGPDDDEQPDHEQHDDEQPDHEERAAADGRTPGELLVALEQAEAQRDEYLDGLQRSRAEFDNFRRRSARDAAGARAAGVGDLATSLLDVLDDLDRTSVVAEASDDKGLAAGIGAVHRKLVDALIAAGLQRVDEADVPFDATMHEAVQQVPADEPVDQPEVAQVLRPGYVHGGRCLRAAMVVVRQ